MRCSAHKRIYTVIAVVIIIIIKMMLRIIMGLVGSYVIEFKSESQIRRP